jgi:two-component system, OmpR family, response regulator RegX3
MNYMRFVARLALTEGTVMTANRSNLILYVEDDKDSCDIVKMLLSQDGYEVTAARTIGEGLRAANEKSLALIILDKWHPDGDGVEPCRQIRAFDSHTPIIFYSGAASETDMQEAMKAGAQAYVIKPYIEQLLDKASLICEAMKRRGKRRQ